MVNRRTHGRRSASDRYRNERADRLDAGRGDASLLLLVTASGIVGMASLWVNQRRKQIGVRRALGARRRRHPALLPDREPHHHHRRRRRRRAAGRRPQPAAGEPSSSCRACRSTTWPIGAGGALGARASLAVLRPGLARRRASRRRSPPAARDASRPVTAHGDGPMPTVLVIDDNPAVATALEVLFSLHDIDTLQRATRPTRASALLAREPRRPGRSRT